MKSRAILANRMLLTGMSLAALLPSGISTGARVVEVPVRRQGVIWIWALAASVSRIPAFQLHLVAADCG
jgi:hypothetical protein